METGILSLENEKMKRRALYNRCPEPNCREETLWMPYEDRCGKCGYGGIVKHRNIDTAAVQKQQTISQALMISIGAAIVFIIGFVTGNIFAGLGLI